MINLLALDFGASNGRAILGGYDGSRLQLSEIHRFSNDPVQIGETLHWDILRLYHELKKGILECVKKGYKDISSIGIDTWGVDFGLLDSKGGLVANPVHYRDARNEGMIEKASSIVPKKEIYEQTGLQFNKFNTVFQLLSLASSGSWQLEKASTLLFIPDLLKYFLTGEKQVEFTIASTSQMLLAGTWKWADGLLDKLGIPRKILGTITDPGTVAGKIRGQVCDELGTAAIPVVNVAEHDTASAVMSVPASDSRFAYLSSGTWSLLGVELPKPIINEDAFTLNYTNEGGFNRTIRLLKNISGLWIYQECKRSWDKSGSTATFDELEQSAAASEPFVTFINPDDDLFYSPGNMPQKIAEYCVRTGQKAPEDKAAVTRCIIESLAMKYRVTVKGLERIIGYSIPVLHIVGGGCRNKLLCQFTSNALGIPVVAGPVEATAAGNLACQLISLGELSGIDDVREMIKRSFPTEQYVPEDEAAWDDAYDRFISRAMT